MPIRFAFGCNNEQDEKGLRQSFCGLEMISDARFFRCADDLLAHLKIEKTDAVLTDLLLPGMDTFHLLDCIHALEPGLRPVVFALSAFSDDRLLLSIRDRMVYCFVKPIQYEVIAIRTLQMLSALEMEPLHQPTVMERIDRQIAQLICALGVPAHLKGYYYLRDAVKIFVLTKNPMHINITIDVYPVVARLYDTQAMLVEHAMRNAIEIAWTRGNIETIDKYFGYTVNDFKGKPSNLEFCAMLAEHIRRRYRLRA